MVLQWHTPIFTFHAVKLARPLIVSRVKATKFFDGRILSHPREGSRSPGGARPSGPGRPAQRPRKACSAPSGEVSHGLVELLEARLDGPVDSALRVMAIAV